MRRARRRHAWSQHPPAPPETVLDPPRPEARPHPRRPLHQERLHHRRRQGRRHGAEPHLERARARARRHLERATGRAPEFLEQIKAIVAQDIVDIMLVSASNLERLHEDGVFAGSAVKPAIRANDTTDIWVVRGGRYHQQPSRPFRSASLKPGAPRHRPRPLLDHLQQRPRRRPALARGVRRLPRRRAGQRLHLLPRGLQPERRRGPGARRPAPLRQRQHPALPRRPDQGRAAALPQDRLQRPEGAGGAGLLRPGPRRRRAGRRRRDHARHLRAAAPGRALRRPRRAVRPQDQPRRVAARHRGA